MATHGSTIIAAMDQSSIQTTPQTVTQVIGTFELLEEILLYLDLNTLLCCKRTSTNFRDVIDGSSRIQKALFFEPRSWPAPAELDNMETFETTIIGHPHYNNELYPKCLPDGVSDIIVLNPLLSDLINYSTKAEYVTGDRFSAISLRTDSPKLREKLYDSTAEASWRRMLVLQPHASFMQVLKGIDYWGREVFEAKTLRHGLYMEELLAMDVEARVAVRKTQTHADGYENLRNNFLKFLHFGYYHSTIKLPLEVRVAFGNLDLAIMDKSEIYQQSAREGICGWDVLSPHFGKLPEVIPRDDG